LSDTGRSPRLAWSIYRRHERSDVGPRSSEASPIAARAVICRMEPAFFFIIQFLLESQSPRSIRYSYGRKIDGVAGDEADGVDEVE
jgi:hypothetical protein